MRGFICLLCLGLLLGPLAPRTAWANGGNSHMWISLEALETLPEGSLRDLLTDPDHEMILLNGSVFPDGGYVVQDDYGETAHWEPFVSGYIRFIRRTYDPPYDRGDAAQHVVFLMGIASHDIADMTYDSLFMKVARVEDASGWSEELLDGFDSATDVFLVADTGFDVSLEPWAPTQELAQVFSEEVGYEVAPAVISDGQDFLQLTTQYGHDKGLNDPSRVAELRARYPWSSAHLLDPLYAGSPPTEALVVAAYWQALWDRLHGVENPENEILATRPAAGSTGHATDHTRPESQIAVVFGYEMEPDTLTLTVTDAQGGEHAVTLHEWGNLVRLVPEADWPADTELTVTVAGGVTSIDGVVFPEDWSFSFHTAPGAAMVCCSDPTPNTSDPAPSGDGGGCSTASDPGGGGLALLLLAWMLVRRRR